VGWGQLDRSRIYVQIVHHVNFVDIRWKGRDELRYMRYNQARIKTLGGPMPKDRGGPDQGIFHPGFMDGGV
jgi:uncharacterized protein YecE (DUF72 family)